MAASNSKSAQQNTKLDVATEGNVIPLLDKGFVAILTTNPITGNEGQSFLPVAWPSTKPGKRAFFEQCSKIDSSVYGDLDVYDIASAIFGDDKETLVSIAASVDDTAKKILATYKRDNAKTLIAEYIEGNGVDVGALFAERQTAKAALAAIDNTVKTHQTAIGKILDVSAMDVALTSDGFYVATESFERKTRTRHVYNWAHKTEYTNKVDSPIYGTYTVTLKRNGNVGNSGKGNWVCTLKSDTYGKFERKGSDTKPYALYVGKKDNPGVLWDLHLAAIDSGNLTKEQRERKITASVASDFAIPEIGNG